MMVKRPALFGLAAGLLALGLYGGAAYGGLGYVPGQLVYELGIGESQTRELPMILDTVGDLEVFATGRGSELLTFEEYIPITETHERFLIDVTVSVPDDYVCEGYLEPDVFVRQIGSSEGLIVIQQQIFTPARITIQGAPENPDPAACVDEPVDDTASEPEPSVQPAQPAAPAGDEGSQELVATLTIVNPDAESEVDPRPVVDPQPKSETENGGCLIATAAYGSELAPQVQMLREIRDDRLMQTGSGSAFMGAFNDVYYAFSPGIADLQRQSPAFKEATRLLITPMLSTLGIMAAADGDASVVGLGLSVIALNLGMYVAAPAYAGYAVYRHRRRR